MYPEVIAELVLKAYLGGMPWGLVLQSRNAVGPVATVTDSTRATVQKKRATPPLERIRVGSALAGAFATAQDMEST